MTRDFFKDGFQAADFMVDTGRGLNSPHTKILNGNSARFAANANKILFAEIKKLRKFYCETDNTGPCIVTRGRTGFATHYAYLIGPFPLEEK